MAFSVQKDDPARPDVAALLALHHALMLTQSPVESCHVKTGDELGRTGAYLMSVRDGDELLGIGAFLDIGAGAVELKSMHVLAAARGKGAGRALLNGLIVAAGSAGARKMFLETGSGDDHAAARAMYLRAGFRPCAAFGSYTDDPRSTFMTLALL